MISFALKQAWFWLALAGLVQCWITLIYGGRNTAGLWGRLYYCAFVTLLEGMFCIGMVWHMDPKRMPHAFCIAQTIAFSLGSFALTGLCASFAVASALAVFRPANVNTGKAVLAWHSRYIPLVIFFPVVACVVHTTLLITLDAVQTSPPDDLHCDATDPMWMRLVGYAGVPVVISIPFLALSIVTAARLFNMTRRRHAPVTNSIDDDDLQGRKRHSRIFDLLGTGKSGGARPTPDHRMSAFLPYPSKSRFGRPIAPPSQGSSSTKQGGGLDEFDQEYPLHEHPYPPVDPLTGNVYSPSLDDRETSASFTITAASPQPPRAHIVTNWQSLSPHVRSESISPDSAFSSSMPMFASNPSLPFGRSQASTGSHHHLHVPGEDFQVGVAITTDESPRGSHDGERESAEGVGEMVGLAVTTDEPDLRMTTPTPTLRLRTPSPIKRDQGISPAPSDQTVQDISRSQDSSIRPHTHMFTLGPVDRTRSSESVVRASPAAEHPLRGLAHPNHSAPHALSSPGPSVSQNIRHQRQASFVSSATFYSAPYPFPDREERELLPFSPQSASSMQSPMTPKDMDMGIDLALDLGLGHTQTGGRVLVQPDDHKEGWDDEYLHGTPLRTVDARDPRERLGVYNPTPPTSIACERRRQQKLQRRQVPHTERAAKGLANAVWRMVLFQIAFFSVQLLAALSSILDVARGTVTPFGTQHVALLLAAWGPLFIFGHVPKVTRFWR